MGSGVSRCHVEQASDLLWQWLPIRGTQSLWKCQFTGFHSMSAGAKKMNILLWIPFWDGEILQSQENPLDLRRSACPRAWQLPLSFPQMATEQGAELKETYGLTTWGDSWRASMGPISEPEETENGEWMWPPQGIYSLGQESTAENVRDNCFWESSQTKYLNQKRNVSFLSLYQELSSCTDFYPYQMWHC